MNYSDALVSQLSMLDWWQNDSEESRHLFKHLQSRSPHIASPQILQRNFVTILSQADTYYISKEIADVLVGSFDTLPNSPLGDIRPSSPFGWALFERPVVCPVETPHGETWQVQGLAWGPIPIGYDGSGSALNICIFVHDYHHTRPLWDMPCVSMTVWPWIDGWDHWESDNDPDSANHKLSDWISKLTFSFFAFIRQECVSIQHQSASRPIRRHLPPSYSAEPVIKIIQLRRRSPATNGLEPQSRDYSCRWLVRGHWRNQFYPSSKSHRPRFIPAYVKGPDDKPLKSTKSSIFAVVR
jgi:hypothetical protein